MTPLYKHDCNNCLFCGEFESDGQEFDLWACPVDGSQTYQALEGHFCMVLRYGDEGWEYMSMSTETLAGIEKMNADLRSRGLEISDSHLNKWQRAKYQAVCYLGLEGEE